MPRSKRSRSPAPVAPIARPAFFATALLEGWSVVVVEIVGARALAPYFGSSLQVWTAQITATLLFLALGYAAGGRLSRRARPLTLPALFWIAGAWLLLYPPLRVSVLGASSGSLGIGPGSFASAAILFGAPLLCLGAVSPVLVSYVDRQRPGAGSAAGALFFTNTIGGLGGGWTTAFALIPYLSVSTALTGTGVLLGVLGCAWAAQAARFGAGALVAAAIAVLAFFGNLPTSFPAASKGGQRIEVAYSQQSGVGLLQVIEFPETKRRLFLIDGVSQGGIDLESGRSCLAFSEYLDFLAHRYHPRARRALLLGLGAGVLARGLHGRGIEVTAIELDARVAAVARRFFGMPDAVHVEIGDARTALRQSQETYDLIVLDVFAGENVPWYLTTVEALSAVRARLAPGGRLLINTVANRDADSLGLKRLEASVLTSFPQAEVYIAPAATRDRDSLANVFIVAGDDLQPTSEPFPRAFVPEVGARVDLLKDQHRRARSSVPPGTDDWDDLDSLEAPLRLRWRQLVLQEFGADMLTD